MDELTREFLIESQEGLDRMERCLTDLEERPQDGDLIGDIFRSVHTIKGTTGFLGFTRLEKMAHAGENLLGMLRDGKLSANQPIITGLLQLMDGLRGILRTIELHNQEGTGAESEIEQDAKLIALMHELQHPGTATVESAASPVARTLVPSVAAPPALPDPDTAPRPSAPSQSHPPPAAMLAPERNGPDAKIVASAVPGRNSNSGPDAEAQAEKSKPKTVSATDSTLRVDVGLLNRMMNLVGELVLTRNQILQATSDNPNFTMLARRLDMVTADLRESVMQARMQPVSNVFSKFPRIVRDLSQSLHRKVRLEMEGQDTELDKSLLEAIKDPLTHAVRNSLDHGIEPPDVRTAKGKDPEGILRLRAYQESSHVLIEVSDDGAGIGVERVRSKAIERGLITVERAALLSERELLQLIFLPGFSTAEAVTNVSGRGVGMDVVKTNVEKIGGKVEIDSRPGKGTTLRLRIPLTLAIIPALLVRSLNQSFALPQGALSELVHIPTERVAATVEWMEGAALYRLRGQLLPLIFLDQMLSPGTQPDSQHDSHLERDLFIAVLDADGRRFGLIVDGLADPEEIVVKPLSPVLKAIGLYSGATVLGSGDLALILDPGAIATRAGVTLTSAEDRADKAQEEEPQEPAAAQYLLVQAGDRRAAVPLGDVLRIERIPLSRVEYVSYRPVINFQGQLLPVEDSANVFAEVASNPGGKVTVVVCRIGSRQVGIAVSQVLDVTAGSALFEAGSAHPASGVMLLKEHVTGIVDLDAIAPLSVNAGTGYVANWDHVAEAVPEIVA
jgi:two-component system chemotaxis sensor kinase CheA